MRDGGVEHRIVIEAPASAVWRVLADIDRWRDWSRLYASAAGTLATGGKLDVTVTLPGLKPQRARATIIEATPGSALRYRTYPLGGLMIGHRYVRIEPTGPASCAVVNGERLGGLLGPLVARALGAKLHEGMRLMNEALKAQAEAGAARDR